jgi:hypothetical protein
VVRIFRLYHRRLWGIVGFLIVLGLGLSQTQASAVVSADMTPVDFLQDWLGQLQKYGLLYRSNLIALLINLGYAAIATFLFRLSLRLMRRYYPRLYRKIYRLQRRWFPSIRIQDLELINAQSMVKGLIFIARGLRFFSISPINLSLYSLPTQSFSLDPAIWRGSFHCTALRY